MARFSTHFWMFCLALGIAPAAAQDRINLNEYFQGTGIQLQDSDVLDANGGPVATSTALPATSGAQNGLIPNPLLNRSAPPFSNSGFATGHATAAPASMGAVDPITGLPLHMTSLGYGSAPQSQSPSQSPSPLAQQTSGAAPLPPPMGWNTGGWNAGAIQRVSGPPPDNRISVNGPADLLPNLSTLKPGYTNPVIFEGRIEALDGSLPILPPLPPATDRLASRIGDLEPVFEGDFVPRPELGLLDEVTVDTPWLDRMIGLKPTGDPELDDLCVSRKGWMVIEHWNFHGSWIAGHDNYFGMTSGMTSMTLGFPKVPGFTIRPAFGLHLTDGPLRADMPSRLHDVQLEVGFECPLTERLGIRAALTPGVYSDFEGGSLGDGFRLSGMFVSTWEIHPDLQLVGGTAVLNLESLFSLPILGVVWHPHDDMRIDALFPDPRVSWRVKSTDTSDDWLYVGGSFFGRTWNIERTAGTNDDVTYRDWRFFVGLEKKEKTGVNWYVEGGAAVARDLEYASGIGDYSPRPTAFIRGGVYY